VFEKGAGLFEVLPLDQVQSNVEEEQETSLHDDGAAKAAELIALAAGFLVVAAFEQV
jgi:hypothetical protein